ncbi:MAG: hypothetical protein O2954_20855 [bacterium]|nr:hypothetical protein [bacterium]
MTRIILFLLVLLTSIPALAQTQHSTARKWNEVLLEAIRHDYARPTVHARNLFHTSIAMYDAWAAYDSLASTYFLGRTVGNYTCPFSGVPTSGNLQTAREEAISYAAYRLLMHRFKDSPGAFGSMARFDSLFVELGYVASVTSTEYTSGSSAALGNYLAEQLIAFGLQDGSNEQNDYANQHYTSVNPPLVPVLPGNPNLLDPNHWQPLTLQVFIDQAGNVRPINTPEFLGPEWGQVTPFALTSTDLTLSDRNGGTYWAYHDPGAPPQIDTTKAGGLADIYKWNFALVSVWSGQLDPTDGVMWDISPASFGKNPDFPNSFSDYPNYYNLLQGGDPGRGHTVNPHTGKPYEPQIVPRGDYTRVLAEFWADGPKSETPPGHWFTILNYVDDHPEFTKRFRGTGPVLNDLEWDVKAYFALSGAVHDAAVAAWGIKGRYDYIRPISAIRSMADRGQSTDPNLPSYHPGGIPLIANYIALVEPGDSLAGENGKNVGKIKLYAWRGPDAIANPETDVAGVGWILAENWWPYQRPSFVTPPFAGYISGHSTFSRAAAELMTLLTGDAFFPGGLGEFHAPKNEFLVFEEGPSQDLILQWATYRDASDQTSLSRIWGGIHPPADDLPGRRIGIEVGIDAFHLAEQYFLGRIGIQKIVGDFDCNGTVSFSDFVLFAARYGKAWGDPNFHAGFDLNGNGRVGFEDFIQFAKAYGAQ